MPEPERRLWRALRGHRFAGLSFRRQQPIGPYIADFVCFSAKLVIEADGDSHGHEPQRRHDAVRARFLEAAGFRVVRFWNAEIMTGLDGVLERLRGELIAAGAVAADGPPLPVPPPRGGRGRQPPLAKTAATNETLSSCVPSPLEGEGQGGGDYPGGRDQTPRTKPDRAARHPPASNGTDR
ncbi:endonuclease domain-containing protein [Methylobrevis albus]|uniref:Endonuclease domain-containing protein n=1 Tax=Methylobrevis albus TaxID=2793297 RepID=A0A931HZ08_9HYPH|nr:endonuclease domain-containing protein [Methylobrevis albus]